MPLWTPPSPYPLGPRSGQWRLPTHITAAPAAVTLATGTLFLMPLDIGPVPQPIQALGVWVATAIVGGTTTTTLGIYRDDGTGGGPNMVGGPIASGTVTLTPTGNRTVAATLTLPPGRYWTAFLYVASGTPGTGAQLAALTGACSPMSIPNGTSWIGLYRALTATGLSALPTTQIALTSDTSTTNPLVGIQAA